MSLTTARGLSISELPGGTRGSPARWDFDEAGYCNRHDVRYRCRRPGCFPVPRCRVVGTRAVAKHSGSLPRRLDCALTMAVGAEHRHDGALPRRPPGFYCLACTCGRATALDRTS